MGGAGVEERGEVRSCMTGHLPEVGFRSWQAQGLAIAGAWCKKIFRTVQLRKTCGVCGGQRVLRCRIRILHEAQVFRARDRSRSVAQSSFCDQIRDLIGIDLILALTR